MVAVALQELEPERVQEDQDHTLAPVDAASDLARDIGEIPHHRHSRPRRSKSGRR
jgi:hypothetical protein